MTFPNGECGHIVPPNAITDPGPEPGDIPIQVPAWIVQRNWMNSSLVEAMTQTVPLPEVKKNLSSGVNLGVIEFQNLAHQIGRRRGIG